MTNPSTIWAQLASPAQAAGSIPYVDIDNATINTNVANLYVNPITYKLSIDTKSDISGTDSINTYYQVDSYWPWSAGVTTPFGSVATAGYTVSTSRGTGSLPVISQTGDFVGKFAAWAYTGTYPGAITYQELGGVNLYAVGTTAAVNGIGGELRLFTKQDNGNIIEWLKLTSTGVVQPVAANSVSLGATGYGWTSLFLGYTSNVTPGTTATCNAPSGRVQLSAANSVIVVTNSYITATSVVIVVCESADATALYIKRVLPGAGQVTITMNANSTAAVQLSFLVIGN